MTALFSKYSQNLTMSLTMSNLFPCWHPSLVHYHLLPRMGPQPVGCHVARCGPPHADSDFSKAQSQKHQDKVRPPCCCLYIPSFASFWTSALYSPIVFSISLWLPWLPLNCLLECLHFLCLWRTGLDFLLILLCLWGVSQLFTLLAVSPCLVIIQTSAEVSLSQTSLWNQNSSSSHHKSWFLSSLV